jgi:hypothetical protein
VVSHFSGARISIEYVWRLGIIFSAGMKKSKGSKMFGGLIPDDDKKQQLRTIRTLQAIGAGLIQSLVALTLFFADGFRLSTTGFSLLLVGFWGGAHRLLSADPFGAQSALRRSKHDKSTGDLGDLRGPIDPFFMTRFRFLMVPFLPLVLMYGAFKMTSRQYFAMAVFIVAGYFSDITPSLTVTLSAGVAQYRPKEEIRSIVSRADEALYLAKNSGRNCIKLETDR